MSSDEAFILELLEALAAVRLEALFVGMSAAALHGAPVTTLDVDLLIRDTPANREKLARLAERIGAAKPVQRSDLSNTLTLVGGRVPVDVLFDSIAGDLSFESLRSRAARVPLGPRHAMVASLADIIRSKEAAGRLKDQAQLPILRETLRVLEALGGEPPK